MRTLTLRSGAMRPTEREAVKMRVPEPLYDRGQHPTSSVQKVVLPRRHILRCFYYAKSARGKWVSAEHAICGSRWNWYMSRGRTIAKFRPPEVQKTQFSDGKMKEMEAKREKKRALEKETGAHGTDARAGMRFTRTSMATAGFGSAGTFHSFGGSTTQASGADAFSYFSISGLSGTGGGNPDKGIMETTLNAAIQNRVPAAAGGSENVAEGTSAATNTRMKAGVAALTPQLPLTDVKSYSSETGGRAGGSPAADFKTAMPGSATKTASVGAKLEFSADANLATDANRVEAGGTNGKVDGAVDAGAMRTGWGAPNAPATIAANPKRKEVGYISSWRKREFQLKVANACAEPE